MSRPARTAVAFFLAILAIVLPLACSSSDTSETLTEPDREGRQAEIARLGDLIRTSRGDPSLGRELFVSRCGNCHQLFDVGEGRVGPDLTPYQRDDESIPFLLQVVAFPSAEIHPYHSMFEIRTTDERIITGVMSERDDEAVTMINVAGDEIEIPTDEIASQRPVYTSLMPDHLLTAMTDQQIVDLFAFLLSEQPLDP